MWYQLQYRLAGWREVSHLDQTGLDSVAANPPRLPDVPAPGSRSLKQLSPDLARLLSHCRVPGTRHILSQNHGVVSADFPGLPAHVRRQFPNG